MLKEERIRLNKKELRFIFYSLSLSWFVLFYATQEGTELLTLALIQLFLVQIINKKVGGQYLALAFLARYNSIVLAPFMFLNKNYKKIIKNFIYFILLVFPWLLLI